MRASKTHESLKETGKNGVYHPPTGNCIHVFLFKMNLPSDTKLLLTKSYSEINMFIKYEIHVKFREKSRSFPEISRVQIPSKF